MISLLPPLTATQQLPEMNSLMRSMPRSLYPATNCALYASTSAAVAETQPPPGDTL
jgi:hypothetical protein